MTIPRSHHFVSDFLIKKFAVQDEKVFYLNKRSGLQTPVLMKSKNVFFENNSNTFEHPDGTKDFSVETKLSVLESETSTVFLKIIDSVQLNRIPNLDAIERDVIDEFLLTLFKRLPNTRNTHATDSFFQETLAEGIMKLYVAGIDVPTELTMKIQSEEWKKRALKQAMVTATLKHGDEIKVAMSKKGLWFARPKNPKKIVHSWQ